MMEVRKIQLTGLDPASGRPGACEGHFYPDRTEHQSLSLTPLLFEGQEWGEGSARVPCVRQGDGEKVPNS